MSKKGFDALMQMLQADPTLKGKVKGIAVINDDGMRKVLEDPHAAFDDLARSCDIHSEKLADGITHVIKADGVSDFVENYKDGDIERLAES